MSRKSCTAVAKLMTQHAERFVGVIHPDYEKHLVAGDAVAFGKVLRGSCEAYGRDVRCYLSAASPEMRATLDKELRRLGLKPSTRYNPGGGSTEFPVAYFKAWHWNE